MSRNEEGPVALAGASRADVAAFLGRMDTGESMSTATDLQVRRIVSRYAISIPLALVIVELAFRSGRQP